MINFQNAMGCQPESMEDAEKLERVQQRATKSIIRQKNLTEERLKERSLFSQENRRLRGDLIKVSQYIGNSYKGDAGTLYRRILAICTGYICYNS